MSLLTMEISPLAHTLTLAHPTDGCLVGRSYHSVTYCQSVFPPPPLPPYHCVLHPSPATYPATEKDCDTSPIRPAPPLTSPPQVWKSLRTEPALPSPLLLLQPHCSQTHLLFPTAVSVTPFSCEKPPASWSLRISTHPSGQPTLRSKTMISKQKPKRK